MWLLEFLETHDNYDDGYMAQLYSWGWGLKEVETLAF